MNTDKIEFTVLADEEKVLRQVIEEINSKYNSDYELIDHKRYEVGLGRISVSPEHVKPEILFKMGQRYEILRTKIKINYDYPSKLR